MAHARYIAGLVWLVGCSGNAALLRQGDALRAEKRYDEAAQQYLAALAEDPDDSLAHLSLAALYIDTNRLDEADKALDEARRIEDTTLGQELLATLRVRQKRFDEGAAAFAKLAAGAPENAEYPYRQGTVLARAGKYEPAVKALKAAYKLAPQDGRIVVELGLALQKLKRYDEAADMLKAALRRIKDPPSNASLQVTLGGIYESMRLPDYARFSYEQAARLAPQLTAASLGYGRVLRTTGKADEAIGVLKPLADKQPRDAGVWHELGLAYADFHLPREAEAAERKAIELEPSVPEHWAALASVLDANDDGKDAQLDTLSKAAQVLPGDFDLQMRVGKAALRKKRLPLAREALQRAVTARPNDGDAYYQRALAELAAGDLDAAVATHNVLSEIDGAKANELKERLEKPAPEPPPPAANANKKKGKRRR